METHGCRKIGERAHSNQKLKKGKEQREELYAKYTRELIKHRWNR